MEEFRIEKCLDCANCVWDGAYLDAGDKAYYAWYCDVREDVLDKDTFPFRSTRCKQFLLDFLEK